MRPEGSGDRAGDDELEGRSPVAGQLVDMFLAMAVDQGASELILEQPIQLKQFFSLKMRRPEP